MPTNLKKLYPTVKGQVHPSFYRLVKRQAHVNVRRYAGVLIEEGIRDLQDERQTNEAMDYLDALDTGYLSANAEWALNQSHGCRLCGSPYCEYYDDGPYVDYRYEDWQEGQYRLALRERERQEEELREFHEALIEAELMDQRERVWH